MHSDPCVAEMEVSANTYVVDIWLERLRRDLPTIAEATSSHRPPSDRRRLALGLIEILTRYRLDMYERYGEVWIPTLRGRTKPAYLLPHQFWLADDALQQRLSTTAELLASWHFDEVAPEVLLEEMHTAAELMLGAIVNTRSRRLSFGELVESARARGVFSPSAPDSSAVQAWRTVNPHARNFEDEQAALLVSLKDVRKDVRHRNVGAAKSWLDDHFWEMASLLERIAFSVPPKGQLQLNRL